MQRAQGTGQGTKIPHTTQYSQKENKNRKQTVSCVCMTESLCCSPEAVRTLLIGYTPIKTNKLQIKEIGPHPGPKHNGNNNKKGCI